MNSMELKIEGMTCSRCEHKVELAIAGAGGWGRANHRKASVSIIYDEGSLNLQSIQTAIEAVGFKIPN